jgi:hypothetical protein
MRVDGAYGQASRLLTFAQQGSASVNDFRPASNNAGDALWAAFGRRFLVGTDHRMEFLEYDADGFLHRVMRAPVLDPSPDYDLLAPRAASILPDAGGNFWLGVYGSTDMLVLDKHGRLLGSVHIPANREVQAIGEDWVLLKRRDRLGVQYVEVLRLVKD